MVGKSFLSLGKELMFFVRQKLFQLDEAATTQNICLNFGLVFGEFTVVLEVPSGSDEGVFVLGG